MSNLKLVLSRKGFDSGSGGHSSPLDSQTGKYIWLPIPDKKMDVYQNTIRYEDVSIDSSYLDGYPVTNLADLHRKLFGNRIVLNKRKKDYRSLNDPSVFAHYDPMLGQAPWLTKDQDIVVGRGFGQSNALGSLIKNEVGSGSLFLFFATFESLQQGWTAHYIFGWLKVGEIILDHSQVAQYQDEYGLSDHPHVTGDAFRRTGRKPRNAIFLPDTWLYEDMGVPGCGYFTTLNDSLRLSKNPKINKRTWELPAFFYRNLTQAYQNTWQLGSNSRCTVDTGIGQELILKRSDTQSEQWVRQLFSHNLNNLYTEF